MSTLECIGCEDISWIFVPECLFEDEKYITSNSEYDCINTVSTKCEQVTLAEEETEIVFKFQSKPQSNRAYYNHIIGMSMSKPSEVRRRQGAQEAELQNLEFEALLEDVERFSLEIF